MDKRTRAIESIYRSRYLAFRNALATVTGSHESARDAVQEGFARALTHRDRYRGGSLEAWIWRITLRAALEARTRSHEVALADALDPAFVDPERDPDLAAGVRRLPPRRRLIVFLRYFADLSYEEIAEVCGVSEGTVAASLAQARTTLAAALDRDGTRSAHHGRPSAIAASDYAEKRHA
jgi:RNA polymerase sigma-70 factor (ECF subfamily)